MLSIESVEILLPKAAVVAQEAIIAKLDQATTAVPPCRYVDQTAHPAT